MPPKATGNNKTIKDFFKPFTIPKSRIPRNDVIEDEIIVASPKKSSSLSADSTSSRASVIPRDRGRPRRELSRTGSSSSSLANLTPKKRGRPRKDSPRTKHASTPTKRSPLKISSMQQHDGAADDAGFLHVSPASSQRRPLQAVEIKAPPPPVPVKCESREQSAATSFSSTSTLTSVPLSSQSSSKRIVKNGMHAVTNSDSGSDDTDSSDELADISSFVPSKRRKLTPPPRDEDSAMELESTAKPKRRSARISDGSTQASTRSNTPTSPRFTSANKVYKHSLANMIKQRQKLEKGEAKIQEIEAAFEESRKRREEEERREGGLKDGLHAAVADDSDEGERMRLAMARTEALQDEQKFYFFRGAVEPPAKRPFPSKPGTIWETYSNSVVSREQAFLSGFIAQLANENDDFTNDICEWIVDEMKREDREDLLEAYEEVLQAWSARATWSALSHNSVEDFYQTLQTWPKSIGPEQASDSPLHSKPSGTNGPPARFKHVMNIIRNAKCVRERKLSSLHSTIAGLLPALIDSHVASDMTLQVHVQGAIERMLDSVPEEITWLALSKSIRNGFLTQTRLPLHLKCQIVTALPASSERCHELRRSLAIYLIDGMTRGIHTDETTIDMHSPLWADTILARLKSEPEFAVTETTDYELLEALTSVLDVAIGNGFSYHSFRAHGLPRQVGAVGKSSPAAHAETNFNAQIDALVTQLRLMSSRIRDAGTSHLRRTEAKSAIDRLVLRLEYCVRTKPKQKQGIFGDKTTAQQRDFLSSFLTRTHIEGLDGDTDLEGDFATVVPPDILRDRQAERAGDIRDDSASPGAAVNLE